LARRNAGAIWAPEVGTAAAAEGAGTNPTDTGTTTGCPTTADVVITTPKIPGLELHLPRGSVIKDHHGNVVREVNITPIPVDRPPFPLPKHIDVPVYFTIQRRLCLQRQLPASQGTTDLSELLRHAEGGHRQLLAVRPRGARLSRMSRT
jgi:hypothetical protein